MASSLDGRLLANRWTPPAGGIARDQIRTHYEFVAEKLDGDAWLIGRTSMAPYATGSPRALASKSPDLRTNYVAARDGRKLAVTIDPRGKLHYDQDHAAGDHIVSIVSASVGDDYLAELREVGVSYIVSGSGAIDLPRAMEALSDMFGVKTVLLEGGGLTNGYFLKAGLIDEISLLLFPAIDGLASAPSIFEYIGAADERPARGKSLRHTYTETLYGGVVWLRYNVEAETLTNST
jgi:riboflavin biosynthesis pyrimidine reductase